MVVFLWLLILGITRVKLASVSKLTRLTFFNELANLLWLRIVHLGGKILKMQ